MKKSLWIFMIMALFSPMVIHALEYHSEKQVHFVLSYDESEDLIQFEDGSVWKLDLWFSDKQKLKKWKNDDVITIENKGSVYTNYGFAFTIRNQRTQESFYSKMIFPAFDQEIKALWIVDLDWGSGRVSLNDGSHWYIPLGYRSQILEWRADDLIIMGHYDAWISDCSVLLINASMSPTEMVMCKPW